MNRYQKSGKDFAEWRPRLNQRWFADTIIMLKAEYRLAVDSREKADRENTLRSGSLASMVISGAAQQSVVAPASSNQQTATRQQA